LQHCFSLMRLRVRSKVKKKDRCGVRARKCVIHWFR